MIVLDANIELLLITQAASCWRFDIRPGAQRRAALCSEQSQHFQRNQPDRFTVKSTDR